MIIKISIIEYCTILRHFFRKNSRWRGFSRSHWAARRSGSRKKEIVSTTITWTRGFWQGFHIVNIHFQIFFESARRHNLVGCWSAIRIHFEHNSYQIWECLRICVRYWRIVGVLNFNKYFVQAFGNKRRLLATHFVYYATQSPNVTLEIICFSTDELWRNMGWSANLGLSVICLWTEKIKVTTNIAQFFPMTTSFYENSTYAKTLETPKSPSLRSFELVMNTLAGFKSLCMIRILCKYWRANPSWTNQFLTWVSWKRVFNSSFWRLMCALRSPQSAYSMTMCTEIEPPAFVALPKKHSLYRITLICRQDWRIFISSTQPF